MRSLANKYQILRVRLLRCARMCVDIEDQVEGAVQEPVSNVRNRDEHIARS